MISEAEGKYDTEIVDKESFLRHTFPSILTHTDRLCVLHKSERNLELTFPQIFFVATNGVRYHYEDHFAFSFPSI